MTDRDRLIELIKGAKKNTKGANSDLEREMLFVDYLLSSGVIVPPCPIGTKIYMLVTKRPKLNFPEFTFIKDSKLTFHNIERVIKDFGKEVFLTKEEAEQALKEMVGDTE